MTKYSLRWMFMVFLCCLIGTPSFAQEETDCNPVLGNGTITQGDINYNYGSVTNGFSNTNRSSFTIGQPYVVKRSASPKNTMHTGFWSSFLLPPSAPAVIATQGDFPDRVQLSWKVDPLGSQATDGFKILRDGNFLALVDPATDAFVDFNTQAGEFYEYSIVGINQFGDGVPGKSVGFVNPNGVVTGKVTTFSGNPVPGAVVTLSPTFGSSLRFDGIGDYVCVSHNNNLPTDMFTVSAWVKIGNTDGTSGIIDFGKSINKNFNISSIVSGGSKSISIGIGQGSSTATLSYDLVDEPDAWRHIAAVYGAQSVILYVDGKFVGSEKLAAPIVNEAALFTLGSYRDQTGFFEGWIDDVRIYNRLLSQTEIFTTKDITLSSATEGLVAYLKFDEGIGRKVFDLSDNNIDGFLSGAEFSEDTPELKNAGITDESGYYFIEGIDYSKEQTFLAKPEKIFYENYSLEFNAAYEAAATLTNFDLKDSSHIELTIHPFDLTSKQSILSKMQGGTEAFNFYLEAGKFYLTLNGESKELGPAMAKYQHIALGLNGTENEVKYYNGGTEIATLSYSNIRGEWNDEVEDWQLGAKNVLAPADFYTGLVDEVAFYDDNLLSPEKIQSNAASFGEGGTDIGHPDLLSYFDLNEGSGAKLLDIGPSMSGKGTINNAVFSIITYRQGETPHEFQPDNKLINLNSSATAVSGVDFTDISTVPIAGVVRFQNTFCYQDSVEILVNGESMVPPIITDEEGRFVADFEPGANVRLTPKFGEGDAAHLFFPGFFEVRKLNRPIAGVLFQNLTKRQIKGKLTGGLCEKSIIPEGAVVKMKVRALNGCFETIQDLNSSGNLNPSGNFTFNNLPPIPVAVSLIEHSNNVVYEYFQTEGGIETDLRLKNDTLKFVYRSPPNVEISDLKTNSCGDPMLNILEGQNVKIKVYEDYDGGRCYLDSAALTINNTIADLAQFDTTMVEGEFNYSFRAGEPNIISPFIKTLQVTATLPQGDATETKETVVLGRRARSTTFRSSSPRIPTLILRDPPGDNSFAYIEEGTTTCQSMSISASDAVSGALFTKVSAGVDRTTSVGLGAEVELSINATADLTVSTSITTNNLTTNDIETCYTVTKTISTSDGDNIVGSNMGGDVYATTAINFVFGITDELLWDEMACAFVVTQGVYVFPDGFTSELTTSEAFIKSITIPNLVLTGDQESADQWQEIIDRNTQLKNQATFSKNISFDAGVVYEESETIEVTKSETYEWTFDVDNEIATELGLEVDGVGGSAGLTVGLTMGESKVESNSELTSRTVGYTLADDDFLDNISVSIKKDETYGTPVFDVISGQTSCPHEPKTQPREGVDIRSDSYVAVNIPENDVAVFNLTLGNTAESGDVGFYILELVNESNPNSAEVTAGGDGINNGGAQFQIPALASQQVELTIARGPTEYHYEDIKVAFYSLCEFEQAMALGKTRDQIDPKFYQEVEFDITFLEACSPIGIGSPMQGWVVTPDDNNQLTITLDSYDNTDPDLELIRVQYRPVDGDGSWINITEVLKADLGPVFELVTWNMEELQDGQYEIRAVTQCTDVSLNPGISEVIQGRKETQPPRVLGVPQPSDGVLHKGDEISITFSKRINCTQIFAADGTGGMINNNNIGLYDATNGTLVDMTFVCNAEGDKIVITPNVANQYIENRFLRVEVEGIQDLYGNTLEEPVKWEFYVNRSDLIWEGGPIEESYEEGNNLTVTRTIRNQGSTIADFEIDDIPGWMQVSPTTGTLFPGESRLITFEFSDDLVAGNYNQVVKIDLSDGDEPLAVNLRVVCPGPVWKFDAAQYNFTMNMTLQLDIEGELSEDRMDKVGAFIDNELRGWAYLQFEPTIAPPTSPDGTYFAFLTIYGNGPPDNGGDPSNMGDFGKDIQLKIWDVSECTLYGQVMESFSFVDNEVIGSPLEPTVVHTMNLVERKIPIRAGWNWISYNVIPPDPSVNGILSSLTQPTGGVITNHTDGFATYSGSSWLGSLTEMTHETMYQYRSDAIDSILLVGAPIQPSTVSLNLANGWNGIGFIPQQGLPVTEALGSLSPLNGDVIKSQVAFAQYVAGTGWIGNLNFMSSPNGYLLKITNTDPNARILTYPDNANGRSAVEKRGSAWENHWTVEPHLYQYNMNMIGIVQDEDNLLEDGDEVAAFVKGELRGLGKTVFIESLNAHVIFLTAYANQQGEEMNFRFFDRSEDKEIQLSEQFDFVVNQVYGAIEEPVIWKPAVTSTLPTLEDKADQFTVYPNPANERVYLNFYNRREGQVTIRITDVLGREIERLMPQAAQGDLTLEWIPGDVGNGIYFITLYKENRTLTRRVIIKN